MKTLNLTHLTESVRKFVEVSSDEDRILACRKPRWINYTVAKEIIDDLETLLFYPIRDRMPGRLIIGDSNNGKTAIILKVYRKYEAFLDENQDVKNPILLIQTPNEADENALYDEILFNLDHPIIPRQKPQQKKFRVISILKELGVKMLILDEVHNLLAGSGTRHRITLNAIRTLHNSLKIPIIGVGTKEALNAINSDPQLRRRFKKVHIPRWKLDNKDNKNLKELLLKFSRSYPLKKPSDLTNYDVMRKIIAKSSGLIGEISDLLEDCAVYAIERGTESITLEVINIVLNSSKWNQTKK